MRGSRVRVELPSVVRDVGPELFLFLLFLARRRRYTASSSHIVICRS
jgi:hypothetical protein